MKVIILALVIVLTGCAHTDPRCGGDHRCSYLITRGYQPQNGDIPQQPRLTRTIEYQWGIPTGRTWETQ